MYEQESDEEYGEIDPSCEFVEQVRLGCFIPILNIYILFSYN